MTRKIGGNKMKEFCKTIVRAISWLLIVFVGFACVHWALFTIDDADFIAVPYVVSFVSIFFVLIFAPFNKIFAAVLSVLPYLLPTIGDMTYYLQALYVLVPTLICNIVLYLILNKKDDNIYVNKKKDLFWAMTVLIYTVVAFILMTTLEYFILSQTPIYIAALILSICFVTISLAYMRIMEDNKWVAFVMPNIIFLIFMFYTIFTAKNGHNHWRYIQLITQWFSFITPSLLLGAIFFTLFCHQKTRKEMLREKKRF